MLAQHLSPTTPAPFERGLGTALPLTQRSDRVKRAFDVIVALSMSIVALPIVAAAWVVVRATSTGPGFYSQVRVGRNGRHYRIYKIRTMYHNCEAGTGAAWSSKSDRRVTRVGRILRKLHIDELPQILNVLQGDMSLVGPRPERPEFVGPLSVAIPGYTERLAVRPGVTGLAQIQLPPDSEIECVRRKLVLDRCYAHCSGLWLDFRILFGTGLYLLGLSYSTVRKTMRLPNPLDSQLPTYDCPGTIVVSGYKVDRVRSEIGRLREGEGAPMPCGDAQ